MNTPQMGLHFVDAVAIFAEELDDIGFVEFGHEDVVRHKLVQRIVEAYKRHAEETGTARQK